MTQDNTSRPVARKIDLVTREMPDEVLVYDLKTHQAHCLNQTAAIVWKYCNGKNSVTDIAELLALETSTAVDEAATWLALERLGKANLLEVHVTPPAGSPRLSRRETVKRLGMGFALAVPVVMSVVAPAAAAAGSACPAAGGATCLTITTAGAGCGACPAGQLGNCTNSNSCGNSNKGAGITCAACVTALAGTGGLWRPN